jgi:D-xylose transport system permease protein
MSVEGAEEAHVPSEAQSYGEPSLLARLRGIGGSMLPIVIGLLVVWTYFEIANSNFLTPRNLTNLLVQISSTGIIAIGLVLILLIGEIDLSVGSVAGLASAVLALLLVHGTPWWLSIIAMIAVGALTGLLQGAWIVFFGVPSFIVTLGGLLGFYGLQLYLIQTENADAILVGEHYIGSLTTTYLPGRYAWPIAILLVVAIGIGRWRRVRSHRRAGLNSLNALDVGIRFAVGSAAFLVSVKVLTAWRGIPTAAILFVGLVGVFAVATQRTRFGRYVYAIGGNANGARRAGIKVRRVRLAIFMFSGTLAAVGGLVAVSNLGAADTTIGGGTVLLEAIAAAVIGGVSLFGGRGSVWGALFGALVIGSVSNGLDLTGSPATVKFMVEGLILLIAVTADVASRRGHLLFSESG